MSADRSPGAVKSTVGTGSATRVSHPRHTGRARFSAGSSRDARSLGGIKLVALTFTLRTVLVLVSSAALLGACGDDDTITPGDGGGGSGGTSAGASGAAGASGDAGPDSGGASGSAGGGGAAGAAGSGLGGAAGAAGGSISDAGPDAADAGDAATES